MHFAISQVAPYKDVIVVLESKYSKKKTKKKHIYAENEFLLE